jgi:hypothetical protein
MNAAHQGPGARPKSSGRERAKMRRRLRQQQRVREALLLDLGALVFELHRQGRRNPELLQAKAAELTAVDDEVRALADALDAGEDAFRLVAPGIAGSCESCGAILTTDARFCSRCGAPADPALARRGPSEEVSGGVEPGDRSSRGTLAEEDPGDATSGEEGIVAGSVRVRRRGRGRRPAERGDGSS